MPGGDQTGPRGMGPLTGWGRGDCGGRPVGRGRGFGRGRGAGRGFRRGFRGADRAGWMGFGEFGTTAQERRWLENEVAVLESELESVRARLGELHDGGSDSQRGSAG